MSYYDRFSTDVVFTFVSTSDTTVMQTVGMRVATNISAISEILSWPVQSLPLYGWYNIFRPAALSAPVHAVRLAFPMRRPQARACRVDRLRWKRRRFVQALRRLA